MFINKSNHDECKHDMILDGKWSYKLLDYIIIADTIGKRTKAIILKKDKHHLSEQIEYSKMRKIETFVYSVVDV